MGLALELKSTSIEALANAYGRFVGVRTNHVVSTTGEFKDANGSSRGLSTPNDLQLLLSLRSLSDIVLVDAATARREKYRKPKASALGIISRSGDFSGIPAIENRSEGVLLFSASQDNLSNERVWTINPRNPFQDIVTQSLKLGYQSMLLEAGPTLTQIAFQEGVVGQSAVTVTGISAEQLEPRNPWDQGAKMRSLAVESGASYSLWSH